MITEILLILLKLTQDCQGYRIKSYFMSELHLNVDIL